MEKYNYIFKNIVDAKKFIKRIFKSDIYKYHVRLILKENDDIFHTSLNSEISTTFDKFNKNLDELYLNYIERYNTSVQIILGIEIIIYIIKDNLNSCDLNKKKMYMDVSHYIINNYDLLCSRDNIKFINNNNVIEKKENLYTFSFNKIKNYITTCIDLIKKCI